MQLTGVKAQQQHYSSVRADRRGEQSRQQKHLTATIGSVLVPARHQEDRVAHRCWERYRPPSSPCARSDLKAESRRHAKRRPGSALCAVAPCTLRRCSSGQLASIASTAEHRVQGTGRQQGQKAPRWASTKSSPHIGQLCGEDVVLWHADPALHTHYGSGAGCQSGTHSGWSQRVTHLN